MTKKVNYNTLTEDGIIKWWLKRYLKTTEWTADAIIKKKLKDSPEAIFQNEEADFETPEIMASVMSSVTSSISWQQIVINNKSTIFPENAATIIKKSISW